MLACRVSVSLSVFLVFILIPSTGFAQTCERDGGQCTEKKVEDCGCSKLVRPPRSGGGGAAMTSGVMPPDSQDVPVAVPLDSRPRSTDDETPGEENDKREDEPKQSKSPTVENTDDKTQTSKDEKPQSAKMKYIPASEAKSPYPRTNQMSCLPGGLFYMGTDEVFIADDGEQPSRPVHLRPFCIDVHEVSIAEFELFVNSTGYVSYVSNPCLSVCYVSYLCVSVCLLRELPLSVCVLRELSLSVCLLCESPLSVCLSVCLLRELPMSVCLLRELPLSVCLLRELPLSVCLLREFPLSVCLSPT